MESTKTLFCSSPLFPPRIHPWNALPSSSYTSVLMLREQVAPTVTSWCTSFSAQNFPTSVLLQDQCNEYRPLLHISKKGKACQATLNTREMDMISVQEENDTDNAVQVAHDFRKHLLPRLENLLTSSGTEVDVDASSTLEHADSLQCNAVSLTRKAFPSSKQAASIAEDLSSVKADEDAHNSISSGLASAILAEPSLGRNKTVRSTRHRERRAKEKKVPKSKVKDSKTYLTVKNAAPEKLLVQKKINKGSNQKENDTGNAVQVAHDFRKHLLPRLENLLTSSQTEVDASSTVKNADSLQCNAVSLTRKDFPSLKQAASIAKDLSLIKADEDADNSISSGLASASLAEPSLGRNKTVRSTRHRERRAKERKVPKSKVKDSETYLTVKDAAPEKLHVQTKINKGSNQNNPLNLFSQSPESKQLLTFEQESQLVAQTQELLRLEELKTSLQSQSGREPTMAEWAEGAGLNNRKLKAQLRHGYRSREKLIQANLRMVHYVAKSYQGRGLDLEDLLQEGSIGLIKSVTKFTPKSGCRFASYAYWWIKQAIRKAIYNHSRTIRLPEKVYNKLSKVLEAKKLYMEEGNLNPSREELARRVGIAVDKVDRLLFVARVPISLQKTVGAESHTTFQEIIADTAIESPDMSVSKQLMRRHVLNVLKSLRPKERRIIRLRFGFEDGEERSLSEIGEILGLSRERVRQLESRALYKVKKSLVGQGLDAYAELLI